VYFVRNIPCLIKVLYLFTVLFLSQRPPITKSITQVSVCGRTARTLLSVSMFVCITLVTFNINTKEAAAAVAL
jgi:hypothetical protein